MNVTLKDIARHSGFSVTTVSRALSGYDDVSQKTRSHILDIAHQLGYRPNQVARQLQGQRTQTVGIIMPVRSDYYEDDFFSVFLKGITFAAAKNHYDVLISASAPGDEEMHAYQRIAGGRRVDGMILARTYRHDPRIEYLQSIDHPFVVLGRSAPGETSDFAYIDIDSRLAIEQLTQHFITYGHRDIGLILPPKRYAYTEHRLAGYKDGLDANGIMFRQAYATHSELTYIGGQEAAAQLLAEQPNLTAIIGCNDLIALGAMAAIKARGLQVGHDIAVGGYDDIPAAARSTPSLTTIQVPIYQLGELLTDLLISLIGQKEVTDHQQILVPQLIVRQSSGSPRTSKK